MNKTIRYYVTSKGLRTSDWIVKEVCETPEGLEVHGKVAGHYASKEVAHKRKDALNQALGSIINQ